MRKMLSPRRFGSLAFIVTILLGAPAPLRATLLVYEGFNYGGSSIANLNGTAATGTGLQGNWTVTNVLPGGGSASSAYQSSGLTFGANFLTSSGGALLSTTKFSGSDASTIATAQLNASTSGVLWSSYLMNINTMALANGGSTFEGIATAASGTPTSFGSSIISNAAVTDRKLLVNYDNASTSSGNTTFSNATDYLVLSKYTNVGNVLTGSTTGVATTWVFTVAGYENWLAGGATEATLTANAVRAQSDAAVITGTYNFDSSGYLTLKSGPPDFNGEQTIVVYDEIRYGTELKDVVAIPEAGSGVMTALGLTGLALVRRFRRHLR